MPPGKIDLQDRDILIETSAAIFWDCSLTSQNGETLELIVDDIGGKILSFFLVDSGETSDEPDKGQPFPQETANLLAVFCSRYYGLEVDMPYVDLKGTSCSLALEDASGRKAVLTLAATKHSLVFNDSNIQHTTASAY